MVKKVVERYYSLKSVDGPTEQIGVVVRATSQLTLDEMTGLFHFRKKGERRGHQDYTANTNTDINGRDRGKKDIIGLRVFPDARVGIYKQAEYAMRLAEIDETEAKDATRRMDIVRSQQNEPQVVSVGAGNPSLGLPPLVRYY